MDDADTSDVDVRAALERVGFDPAESILTQRQAVVLLLRERGHTQAAIADRLGTSRANVANVEASARENVEKAVETVRVVRAVEAPVKVAIPAGTDIYDVPERVYETANRADIKVAYSAPELVTRILDEAETAVSGRTIDASLTLSVDQEGEVLISRAGRDRE